MAQDSRHGEAPARAADEATASAPAPSTRLGTGLRALGLAAGVVAVALAVAWSRRLERPPWAWSAEDWRGFAGFSRERAETARAGIAELDWTNLRTRVTERTRELWDGVPELERRLEERLARLRGTGTGTESDTGAGGSCWERGAAAMRRGALGFRRSPDDPAELRLAKRAFEEAHGLLERAVKEEHDEERKAAVARTLSECNRYLEDCRSREKS